MNPENDSGGASARTMLAAELRRLRQQAKLSLSDLGEKTTYDRTYLHKVETRKQLPSADLTKALDTVYGTDGYLHRVLLPLARQEPFLDRFRRAMQLESQAVRIQTYTGHVVHGLLQTERYARAMLGTWYSVRAADRLEEQVAARMSRQERLTGSTPPVLAWIVDEAVLRRGLDDAAVWREQLRRLIDTARAPHLTIQVLPFSARQHAALGGELTIWTLPDGRSVGYSEGATTGALTENPVDVEHLRLAYDQLRGLSLPPRESLAFLKRVLEDCTSCEPLDPV